MWKNYYKGTKYLWLVPFLCLATTICGAVELTEEDKKNLASDLVEIFKPFAVQLQTLPETGEIPPQLIWGITGPQRWTEEQFENMLKEVISTVEQIRDNFIAKGVIVKGFSVSGPIPTVTVTVEFN
jgi:hypothetical protein